MYMLLILNAQILKIYIKGYIHVHGLKDWKSWWLKIKIYIIYNQKGKSCNGNITLKYYVISGNLMVLFLVDHLKGISLRWWDSGCLLFRSVGAQKLITHFHDFVGICSSVYDFVLVLFCFDFTFSFFGEGGIGCLRTAFCYTLFVI